MENLYKYYGPSRIKNVLQDNFVRFTPFSKLDDLFEGVFPDNLADQFPEDQMNSAMQEAYYSQIQPMIKEFSEELEALQLPLLDIGGTVLECKKEAILGALETRILGISWRDAKELAHSKILNSYRTVEGLINQKFGVFCLSKIFNNPQMWGNYAQNHEGFVIEFDATDSFFLRLQLKI